jgi:hypothetical protein
MFHWTNQKEETRTASVCIAFNAMKEYMLEAKTRDKEGDVKGGITPQTLRMIGKEKGREHW